MTNTSLWIASTEKTNYPTLYEDINSDIAIIGGGIAGITTAYLLKKAGMKVVLVEARHIAEGTSGHTTAKITSQHGLIYSKLIQKFGNEKALMYAAANEAAIKLISNLVSKEQIQCDFDLLPAYVFTEKNENTEKIHHEVIAAKSLGLHAYFSKTLNLPFSVKAAIGFNNQAQFHPGKYLLALAKQIPLNGSYIFENTRVVNIEKGEKLVLLTDQNKKITANKVVIASHFPCYDGMGFYFTRMYSSKSYIIALKSNIALPPGMFINIENPTRSLRTYKDIILAVGEDHKTGEDEDTKIHYENLIQFAKEKLNLEELLYKWSAQDCMSIDGLPYIGRLTDKLPNIYVATGFGKWGITNGTAAAMIISDLILTGSNPHAEVFSPSRFTPLASATNFVAQNLDVVDKFIDSKLTTLPEDTTLEVGEAKVIEIDGIKKGIYKDETGEVYVLNNTCPHLGCSLVWNSAEKTWDCPCHGSCFTYKGEILEGPTVKNI